MADFCKNCFQETIDPSTVDESILLSADLNSSENYDETKLVEDDIIESPKMTIAECQVETQRHIENVRKYIRFMIDKIDIRGVKHDASKLETPEVELFAEFTPKLAETTYGSDEYSGFLEKLKPALDHHYASNRHHPEHFVNGITDMTLVDIIEMFCDWKASTLRHNDGNLLKSVEINAERFGMDNQLKQILLNTARMIDEHDEKAIVLAGRPYHLDKEVNHGIDTMINSLGLVVLTEDSICHLSQIETKLRVVDQWSYHSRIYHAADVISRNKNIELVNLNSFGCGLDAIVTDQTEEILKKNNKLYTTIKIDEINNLGAAKIRIRSLIASMNKRNDELNYKTYDYKKNYFKENEKKHTILFPDMTKFHMPLFESVLNSEGYKAVYLKDTTNDTVETGLKYVNNDACYPAIIVIGQLVNALKSGEYDLDNTSVIITQTGGGCRATNYIGLIRKALKDAGLEQISIISLNVSGLEKEQAFKITASMANKIVQACVYGDLLMKLLLGTRPYEVEKGTSYKVYSKWQKKCYKAVSKGNLKEYKKNIKAIIDEFLNIKVKKKELPKVGIVGEILIKYHSFGNDHLIEKLEDEGVEVFLPDLMGFAKYCAYNNVIKEKLLKTGKKTSVFSTIALNLIDLYEKPVKELLKDTKYRSTCNIYELAKNVDGILSTGNQTGEGWFLTAEMVELIKDGVENIVCVQPFACLPNHIVGKSVIKKLRSVYSDANIVAIDYDPGASHTNQVNRIKLMLTVAKEKNK